MNVISRAVQKYYEDGIISLLKSSIPFITRKLRVLRVLTPIQRNAVWNEVKVPPTVAPQRRLADDYLETVRTDYAKSEDGECKMHSEFTKPGDRVIIIGGGRGVTTVRSAWESGHDGKVIVYEASNKYSEIIESTVELNDVGSQVDIRNALVGPDIAVYSSEDNESHRGVSPEELPKCDVLEMDCEGAELEVVRNLNIRPNTIIMEVHPQRYDRAPEAIDELSNIGYNIVRYRTNEGEPLCEDEFYNVLDNCSRGDDPAPVIAAVYSHG